MEWMLGRRNAPELALVRCLTSTNLKERYHHSTMNKSTDSSRVLAQVRFIWTPPEGGEPAEFEVALYSTNGVELSASQFYAGIVSGLEWSDEHQAIRSGSGYWDSRFQSDKTHLLLKATNALRRQLGLPAHSATGRFPGTEVQ